MRYCGLDMAWLKAVAQAGDEAGPNVCPWAVPEMLSEGWAPDL
jgi:hypothetical protein